ETAGVVVGGGGRTEEPAPHPRLEGDGGQVVAHAEQELPVLERTVLGDVAVAVLTAANGGQGDLLAVARGPGQPHLDVGEGGKLRVHEPLRHEVVVGAAGGEQPGRVAAR